MAKQEPFFSRRASRPNPRFPSLHSSILNRYIIVEVLPPLSMGLFVVTFALLLIVLVDVMDELFLSGAPMWPMVKLLAFVFPTLLTLALPIGSLLATMLVYGRLVEDRELVAMRAAGMSGFSLVAPAYVMGLLLTAFNFYWTGTITPKSIDNVENTGREIMEQMTSINFFKPGQFNSPQEDLALYFSGMSPRTNTLEKVTIFKSGAESGVNWFGEGTGDQQASNWTVSAPTATLNPLPTKGVLQLVLQDCIAEDLSSPEKISRVFIERATISIDIRYRLSKMSGGSLTRDSESLGTYLSRAEEQKQHYYRYLAHMRVPKDFPRGDGETLGAFSEEFAEKERQNPTPHDEVLAQAGELIRKELENPGYLEKDHGFVSLTELEDIENRILGTQMNLNRAMQRISYPTATFLFVMVGCPLGILRIVILYLLGQEFPIFGNLDFVFFSVLGELSLIHGFLLDLLDGSTRCFTLYGLLDRFRTLSEGHDFVIILVIVLLSFLAEELSVFGNCNFVFLSILGELSLVHGFSILGFLLDLFDGSARCFTLYGLLDRLRTLIQSHRFLVFVVRPTHVRGYGPEAQSENCQTDRQNLKKTSAF